MLASLNRCVLLGTLGRYAPTLTTLGTNTPCASFLLCVTELGADGKPYTILVPCQVIGKRAESVTYLQPGQLVAIEGKLGRRKNKDGQWEMCVSAFDAQPLGGAHVS